MSQLDFTKIRWAGDSKCILITDRGHAQEPILLLTRQDVKRLLLEFESKGVRRNEERATNRQ